MYFSMAFAITFLASAKELFDHEISRGQVRKHKEQLIMFTGDTTMKDVFLYTATLC